MQTADVSPGSPYEVCGTHSAQTMSVLKPRGTLLCTPAARTGCNWGENKRSKHLRISATQLFCLHAQKGARGTRRRDGQCHSVLSQLIQIIRNVAQPLPDSTAQRRGGQTSSQDMFVYGTRQNFEITQPTARQAKWERLSIQYGRLLCERKREGGRKGDGRR
jgi:hypothetical protein